MTDKKTIHQAFIAVCGEVENVTRDTKGQVGTQTYKYATLESVLAVLHPLLKAEGLALTQFVNEDMLFAKLIHVSGAEMNFGAYNLGVLDKHQARGSAITYGRRYQLCAIFGITQEDDDGAAASQTKPVARNQPSSGPVSPQQVYGSSVNWKKRYAEVESAIERATDPMHFDWIYGEIEKMRPIEEQYAMNLEEKVEARMRFLERDQMVNV